MAGEWISTSEESHLIIGLSTLHLVIGLSIFNTSQFWDLREHVPPTVAFIFLPIATMVWATALSHRRILRCLPSLSVKFTGLNPVATMSTSEGEAPAVLIPIADGTEEIEAIAVADVLTRGGMKVTLAGVGRKLQNIVTMSQGTKVQGDIAIEACVDLNFDLIMCPGGPGAQHLHDCAELITMLQKQKHQGRYYGGICAAPAVVLIPHGLLDAGPATTYPSYGEKMKGVDYKPDERVVVNGKCVTSQGPGIAIEMGLKLVELLVSGEKAKSVAQALIA
ncbi:hypothetical protein F441_00322 [Phytophthora nicotianae CJ01A1]|uniref:DJ-1/PfpI domain-containing protein n=1 Tax=Phytophthora nicotianae CJ01A1 TaxID=1317063 RepID=W2XWN6_PHYNI|nr:hypothetical protein F441_00322 [Phytophthora nicotianae CJ01A1]